MSSSSEEVKTLNPSLKVDNEISLLEGLVTLVRHKRLVLAFPFASAFIVALISLALPNIYTGTARVLPPQQSGSPLTAALLGDFGGLGASSAVGSALGLKNPSDLYVGMLQSRTIADTIITRFELESVYDKSTLIETRAKLAKLSNIVADKNGIISIEVDDEDPKRAADIANMYVDELDQLTQRVAITTASRQRVFLEKQLRQAKDQLADAEVALRTTQQRTGLISLTEQGKATIESVAYLQAQIQAKQVQLGAMRTGMTESNPDYIRARRELAGLQVELAKLEKNNPADTSGVIPAAGSIPERGLEYVRKFRDVQYYQTLFELIAKQFEIAKGQEAAEAGLIQILDRATVPDKKTKPYRLLIVLVTGMFTALLGMILAFILEATERARSDPAQSKLLEELGKRLRTWRT